MTREDLDRLWANPDNWGLLYRCAEDPRVIVPRRPRWMGWTVNFAHPRALPALALLVAVAVGPVLVLVGLGIQSIAVLSAALIGSIAALVGLSHWESSRSRD